MCLRIIFVFLVLMTIVAAVDPFAKPNEEKQVTAWVALHQADVKEMVDWLNEQHSLFNKINIGADNVSHQIWLKGDAQSVRLARQMILMRDQQTPQIYIVARIVTVARDYRQQLGVEWLTSNKQAHSSGELKMSLPHTSNLAGQFAVTIADLGFGKLLDLTLSALEHEGHGRVIASPQLLIGDGKTAYIETGENLPYWENAGHGGTAVLFKKAVLRLQVTPKLLVGNRVNLVIHLVHDQPSSMALHGAPAIHTESIGTNVELALGQTIILGGVYENVCDDGKRRVPFLSRIPLFGYLFRQNMHTEQQRELLIFVTPRLQEVLKI